MGIIISHVTQKQHGCGNDFTLLDCPNILSTILLVLFRTSGKSLHELNIFHLLFYFRDHFLLMDIYILETVQLANQNLEYQVYESVWNVYMTMHLKTTKIKLFILILYYQMFVHGTLLRRT